MAANTTRPVKADAAEHVSKAALKAATAMGLTAKRFAAVIGSSEPTISRMKTGEYTLDPANKNYELAVLLIRVFQSLDVMTGGDTAVMVQWMWNDNSELGGRPVDKIETVTGLVDVLAYLDARRAPA